MRLLLVALAILAFARPAKADDPDVRTLDGEKLTFDKQVSRYSSMNKRLQKFPVRVASEGYRPLSRPSPDSDPSGAEPVRFLDELLLIGENRNDFQNNKELYFLLGVLNPDESTRLVGWVPKSLVLTSNRCNRKEGSQITIKAMIVNSMAYLTKQEDAAKYRAPRVRLAPEPNAPDEGEFRFFDFYFVWSDTNPTDDKSGYALLGDVDQYNAPGTIPIAEFRSRSKILGWVDKSRLCFWRTREAIQWDDLSLQDDPPRRRSRPGVTYATQENALFAAGLGPRPASGAEAYPVNEEPFVGGKPVPWEGDRMRYPLLTIKLKNGRELPYESFKGGRVLRKVGVIGDIFDESGRKIMTQAVRKRLVDDLERARRELERTKILFVIDRTRSMEQWWVRTAEWTNRLIEQVTRDGRSAEVGFCFYGDVHPGSGQEGKATLREMVSLKAVVPGSLLDVSRDKVALANKLRELADISNPIASGYREEAVYAGLEVGLLQADWKGRDNARHGSKMVILIGDDGNHMLPPAEEQMILDRIAEFLVPSKDGSKRFESPIEFYALQVCQVNREENDPTALFEKQAKALVAKVRSRATVARAGYFNAAADSEKFFNVIDQRYSELRGNVRRLQEELSRAERGQIGSGSQFRVPEGYRIFEDIAAGENVPVDVALKGIQAFEERWVWADDAESREPQVRQMILVSQGQLDRLTAILRRYLTEQENPPTLKDLATAIVEFQSGDSDDSRKAFQSALRDRRGDEFVKETILRLKVSEEFGCLSKLVKFLGWDRLPGEPEAEFDEVGVRSIQDELIRKYLLLEDLRNNRVQKYRKEPGKPITPIRGSVVNLTGQWKRGFQRLKSGASTSEGEPAREGTIWYWVDVDREWP